MNEEVLALMKELDLVSTNLTEEENKELKEFGNIVDA